MLVVVPSSAQVLKASLTVDFGLMPAEEVNILDDLGSNIEDYINNFAYTDDEYETDIDVSLFIMIETVSKKGHEKIYKAQFQIKSVSGESFYDKDWEFPYQPGYLFDHSKIEFDPLCHFIDYYALLILGGELDGYDLLQGTPYYNEAQNLANIGLLSKYSKGWSNRLQELQKILNVRTRPLREAKPDFFEAKYLLEEGKLKESKVFALKVLDNINKVVNEQPNNKYLKTFFDAHHVTFAKIFAGDITNLDRLVSYDNYHRETYREVMND
jgi:hypothetical protein